MGQDPTSKLHLPQGLLCPLNSRTHIQTISGPDTPATASPATSVIDDYPADASTTGTVSVGGSATGTIETSGDTDWFRVTLTAGTPYRFNENGSPSGGGTLSDSYLRLYDGSFNLLTSNDDSYTVNADSPTFVNNSQFFYTPTVSGTYYVSSGAFSSNTGTYTIHVTIDDYASDINTTGVVGVGGSNTGSIETSGDRDWFAVTLTAGQTYQFDLKGSATGQGTLADPFLRLRDSSNSLPFNDDNGTNLASRISYTATASGTYYPSADLATSSGTGTYRPSAIQTTVPGNLWISEGPAPGIIGQEIVLPNNQINGAIQAIAVDPTNANIMYVGSVNGGIWRTTNATAASPHWVPLTDNLPSLSIGALEFDPTDATRQTLIAGIGSTSSYFLHDTPFSGVLRTTDGGVTWSQLGAAATNLGGENITSVAARGSILLAAADNAWGGGLGEGLFRSTDSGATWALISNGAHGLPNLTSVSDLVGDPLNSNVLYAAVTGASGGVFKSTDTGLTWTNITSGIGIIGSTTDKIELAVHHDVTNLDVFATVDNGGTLRGLFRSVNGGSFVALDVPSGGGQGEVHGAIAADPSNPNIAYVGLGGGSSHYLTRIDASRAPGSQLTDISGGSFGSPHVDTREMRIDANGNLILGTDGGLFRLPTPTGNTGVWSAIVGDISAFELHSIAYDHVSHVIMAGAQDNGTLFQQTPGGTTWNYPGSGDGGDVVIDDVSLAASGQSIRYFSSQGLRGWKRQVYDLANHLVSSTFLTSIPDPRFTTPVELNNVNPTRLLVGGSGAHLCVVKSRYVIDVDCECRRQRHRWQRWRGDGVWWLSRRRRQPRLDLRCFGLECPETNSCGGRVYHHLAGGRGPHPRCDR